MGFSGDRPVAVSDRPLAPVPRASARKSETKDEGTGREKIASYFSFPGLLYSAYSSSSTAMARAAADGTR